MVETAMSLASLLVFLLTSLLIDAQLEEGNQPGVYRIHNYQFVTFLLIGTPPQEVPVMFDFATVPLLVTSEQCGHHRAHCPIYCNDRSLSFLYCDELCFPITPQMVAALCRPPVYSSNSTTFERLDGRKWTQSLQCCRNQFYGEFVRDRVQFLASDPAYRNDSFELEFVEGTYMQSNAFAEQRGLLGLGFRDASGSVNFVEQLFRAGKIDAPIITLSVSNYALVGAVDEAECENWSFLPVAANEEGWTVEFERIEIYGVAFAKQRATFDSSNPDLVIPQAVFRQLVDAGIVLKDCRHVDGDICVLLESLDSHVYLHTNEREYSFELTSETNRGMCVMDAHNRTFCDSWAQLAPLGRSFAAEPWVLNRENIMTNLCWAFDYAQRTVGIGEWRVRRD